MRQFSAPDQSWGIAVLAYSVLRHYRLPAPNSSHSTVDQLLENAPRNIVLLLLDGLGQDILTRHLPARSFLRCHQIDSLSSVFPQTTTATATALETGLFPSQSGWRGWSIFWPPIGQIAALYPNTTEEGWQAAPDHVGEKCLTVTQLTQRIREEAGIQALSISEQGDIYAKSLDDVLTAVREICNTPGENFLYVYMNEPDHQLHHRGCSAAVIKQWLTEADRKLAQLQQTCPDTLFLLTADHGFIDVDPLCLEDYPELEDTLLRKPSIEPRALNLFVKPGREQDFLHHWKEAVGDSYTLYTKELVLQQQLSGPKPNHPMLVSMLGNYLAVAVAPLTMFPNPSYMKFMKATHGGMTPEELTVPLILWQS